jgi:mannose-1-phosphate guanylyltransferase
MKRESPWVSEMCASPHDWALVLAGGSGRRLAALTRDASGVSVPKQFCSLGHGESLLRMALRRAASIAPRAQTLVDVTQQHEKWWRDLREVLPAENLIVEPEQRGTGIAILRALLEILARDPEAAVAILPSDHYFSNEETLSAGLRTAMAQARKDSRHVLLLGIAPDDPDPELGYIVPASAAEQGFRGVRSFVEKPSARRARALIKQGALWNSFIIAADGRALLGMFDRRCPVIVSRLRKSLEARVQEAERGDEVASLYDQLPSIDFCRDILVKNADLLRVVPLPACGWSDLGTQSRLQRTLCRHRAEISKRPVAPPDTPGLIDLAMRSRNVTTPVLLATRRRHAAHSARARSGRT